MPGPGVNARDVHRPRVPPRSRKRTYKTEPEALGDEFETMVISLREPDAVFKSHFPGQTNLRSPKDP